MACFSLKMGESGFLLLKNGWKKWVTFVEKLVGVGCFV